MIDVAHNSNVRVSSSLSCTQLYKKPTSPACWSNYLSCRTKATPFFQFRIKHHDITTNTRFPGCVRHEPGILGKRNVPTSPMEVNLYRQRIAPPWKAFLLNRHIGFSSLYEGRAALLGLRGWGSHCQISRLRVHFDQDAHIFDQGVVEFCVNGQIFVSCSERRAAWLWLRSFTKWRSLQQKILPWWMFCACQGLEHWSTRTTWQACVWRQSSSLVAIGSHHQTCLHAWRAYACILWSQYSREQHGKRLSKEGWKT